MKPFATLDILRSLNRAFVLRKLLPSSTVAFCWGILAFSLLSSALPAQQPQASTSVQTSSSEALARWMELPVSEIRKIEFDPRGEITFMVGEITYQYTSKYTTDAENGAHCAILIEQCRHAQSLKILVGELPTPKKVAVITAFKLQFDRLK
jgi:hypothetical protein